VSPIKGFSLWLLALAVLLACMDFILAPCLCAAFAHLWISFVLPLAGTPFLAIGWRLRTNFTAGADWAMLGERWIHTYELVSIEVRAEKRLRMLYLVDKDSREMGFGIKPFYGDRRIWDLLHNGIRHSVAHGAETNQLARDTLKLP
jgi:hypothetical protein